MTCDPTNPDDVRREALLSLARVHDDLACDTHTLAERLSNPGLKQAVENAAGVLFALADALKAAAQGDPAALDELGGFAAVQLGDVQFATRVHATK